MAPEAVSNCYGSLLLRTMNSSLSASTTRDRSTKPASTQWHPRIRVRLLTGAEEQKLNDALIAYYAAPKPCIKRHSYLRYWLSCRSTDLAQVGLRTFYRRLQRHRAAVGKGHQSLFWSGAHLDEATFEVKINDGVAS